MARAALRQNDTARGIQDTTVRYQRPTVQRNFEKLSVAGRIGRRALTGNYSDAAGQLAVALGEKRIAKYANRLKKRRAAKGKISVPEKKLTGPVFWLMAALTIAKDTTDFVFAVTFFLPAVFAILTTFAVLIYLFVNDVPLNTRKIASFIVTFLMEILPFVSMLVPFTTINLFLIRKIEHSDHFKKYASLAAKKGKFGATGVAAFSD